MTERYLFIHSQDRDPDLYPDPAQYIVKLDPPLRHVRYLQVEHFTIANTLLTIRPWENTITVNNTTISIPPGMYSSTKLAAAVEEGLRAHIPQGEWVVRIERARMSMRVFSVHAFTIESDFLQFSAVTREDSHWSAETGILLPGASDRLVMDIRPIGKVIEPDGVGGRKSYGSFHNIVMNAHSGGYAIEAKETPVRHTQNPSITLDRLHVVFRTKDPVVDHGMLIRVGFE